MYETTSELLAFLQEEVNDVAPEAATQARYLRLLDKAHKAIVAGGGELNLDTKGKPVRDPFIFPWALASRPKSLTLEPKTEGTADVTYLSTSVVNCSVNSGTKNLTGFHVRFATDAEVYYITLHSGTTITLESGYANIDVATGRDFDAFKLIYSVGSDDIYFPADQLRTYASMAAISMVDLGEVLEQFPLHRLTEKEPELVGVTNQDSNGNLTLQFSHSPQFAQKVDLYYVARPADLDLIGSDPILPNYRTVLVHLAAFYHLRKRDDDRAQSHFGTARALFDSLTSEARRVVNSDDADLAAVKPFPGGFNSSNFRFFTRFN